MGELEDDSYPIVVIEPTLLLPSASSLSKVSAYLTVELIYGAGGLDVKLLLCLFEDPSNILSSFHAVPCRSMQLLCSAETMSHPFREPWNVPSSTKRASGGSIPKAKSDRLSYGNNIASTARRQVVGNGHYHAAPPNVMQTPRFNLSYFNAGPPPGTAGTVYDEDVTPSALPLRRIDPNVMDERKPAAKPDLSPTSADLAASCKKEHHPAYAKMMVEALDAAISASNSKKNENEEGGTKKYAAKKDGGGSNGLDEYPPTLQNDGFDCTKQHENKHCASYKCRCNRATSCKFKLELSEYGEVRVFGEHTRDCYPKNGKKPPPLPTQNGIMGVIAPDVKEEMKAHVDRVAIEDPQKMPNDIASETLKRFHDKYGDSINGLNRKQLRKRVEYARHIIFGDGGAESKLLQEAMSSGKDSMVRFIFTYMDGDKREKLIGMTHRILKKVLNQPNVSQM